MHITHAACAAFEKPNGLALSPDQTRLYIGESKFGNSRCAAGWIACFPSPGRAVS